MVATRLAIVGTVVFLISVVAVVFLVSSLVFDNWVAPLVTAGIAAIAGWAWFYLPVISFSRDKEKG